jgi:hypothetical protein
MMLSRHCVLVLAPIVVGGCYDVPKPACGFRCGPAAACPADYTCAADDHCHLNGTPASLSCPLLDAGVDAEPGLPQVIKRVPLDKEENVATSTTLRAVFNKPVTGVSSSSFTLLLRDSSTPVPAVVSYDPETRTALLDPDELLISSRVYDATLGADITDLHGNALAATQWSFRTALDTTPPTLTMTSPTSGATNVAVDASIIATFSEPVANLTTSSFLLAGPAGMVAGTVGYVGQTSVRLTAANQLEPQTAYTATLTSAVSDASGNTLVGAPIAWTFTTGADTVAPVIETRNPFEDDTGVLLTTTVIAYFSEPVIGVSTSSMVLTHAGTPVPAAVTYTASSRRAQLVPDAPLLPNTAYVVTLDAAITDASGNALPGAPVSWMFTTGP